MAAIAVFWFGLNRVPARHAQAIVALRQPGDDASVHAAAYAWGENPDAEFLLVSGNGGYPYTPSDIIDELGLFKTDDIFTNPTGDNVLDQTAWIVSHVIAHNITSLTMHGPSYVLPQMLLAILEEFERRNTRPICMYAAPTTPDLRTNSSIVLWEQWAQQIAMMHERFGSQGGNTVRHYLGWLMSQDHYLDNQEL